MRNGGIDYVSDPSSAHFSDAPIPKLVRELIQNSLDAKEDGLPGPVAVTFSETRVDRNIVGGAAFGQDLAPAPTGSPPGAKARPGHGGPPGVLIFCR